MGDNSTSTNDRVSALVEPIADDFGVELVEVDFAGGVLKVVIDEPEGVSSRAIVDVTKAVSRMIDAEDPIVGRFTLEVTSPGVERPLKTPAHFDRAVGSEVTVKTNPEVEGDRRVDGYLESADEYGVTIRTEHGPRSLRYGEIRSARTVFDWGPGPKPGKTKNTKSSPVETSTKESAAR